MLSRRNLIKAAGLGAAAAASSVSFPTLPSWAAPPRVRSANGPILLDSNENAYGPFPSVLALGNPFMEINRYPDRYCQEMQERLAGKYKVEPSRILLGCGSTEILRMAANAFTGPGKTIIRSAPTFEGISEYGQIVGARTIEIPLASNFCHDLGAMLKAAGPETGLIYLCNPNNPTGNITPRADIEDFLSKLPKNIHVVIDEAYYDFVSPGVDYISFLDRPVEDERLIVSRTFSKIYALAGMRLGYAVVSTSTAKHMLEQKLKDNINAFVLHCALTSLSDETSYRIAQQRNAADRDEFTRQAIARNLSVIPSSTNFVMLNTNMPVQKAIAHFQKNKIEIGRPFPPLNTYARISLGKPDEMKEFWRVWDLQELPS
ncbi:MAG TPA: histidinol-phosphate transaminase [Candidatus Angelobacter sp.]|nr:histidinol-phosphate transaminase [Candidatus Angelobacter sp.]